MSFLTPMLALIAGAVAVPALLILYFLKLKRRDAEVSSTLLWKKAIQDLQANSPFQRLRNNILLLLQLLALLAALLALAQPELRGTLGAGGKHVLVIDRSASMKATDGDATGEDTSRTRLDEAKRQALKFVEQMREPGLLSDSGDEAMVVAFDTVADRVQNFTGNKAELRRAIEGIRATDAPTRFGPAYDTARAFARPVVVEDRGIVNAGSAATVHLFSDGRLPDLADIAPNAEDRLVYYPVGDTKAANVGIVGLRAERALDDPARLSIFVSLQSTSASAQTVEVTLNADGRPVPGGVRDLTVPAQRVEGETGGQVLPGVSGVVFAVERAEGGVFTVQVRTRAPLRDVLATDDVGYLVVPPAKRLAVALVTDGNLFLRQALEVQNLAKLDVFTPAAAAELFSDGRPTKAYDAYVLDGWLPAVPLAGGGSAPGLPAARVLAFNVVPPPPLGLIDQGAGEATVLLRWERDHPALRGLALDTLTVNPSRKLRVPERAGARVLAEGVSGPLMIESVDAGLRALVVTFDLLNAGNWPLDVSFVVFMAQALRSVASEGGDSGAQLVRPGGTIEQQLPAGASDTRITLPDGARTALLLSPEGRAVYGPATSAGIYTMSWAGAQGSSDVVVEGRVRRAIAANLLDPQESALATAPPEALASRLLNVTAGEQQMGARRLWPWALVAVLVLLLVEWWVYNRKVTL
jgi:hypothetical protein